MSLFTVSCPSTSPKLQDHPFSTGYNKFSFQFLFYFLSPHFCWDQSWCKGMTTYWFGLELLSILKYTNISSFTIIVPKINQETILWKRPMTPDTHKHYLVILKCFPSFPWVNVFASVLAINLIHNLFCNNPLIHSDFFFCLIRIGLFWFSVKWDVEREGAAIYSEHW